MRADAKFEGQIFNICLPSFENVEQPNNINDINAILRVLAFHQDAKRLSG